jgi:hypothetical protein
LAGNELKNRRQSIGCGTVATDTSFFENNRKKSGRPPKWDRTELREAVELLEKVIPSIKEKWPRTQWNNNAVIIRTQHDGATTHCAPDDEEFGMGLVELGVFHKILLYKQPLDVNINDLGFFCALKGTSQERNAFVEDLQSSDDELGRQPFLSEDEFIQK